MLFGNACTARDDKSSKWPATADSELCKVMLRCHSAKQKSFGPSSLEAERAFTSLNEQGVRSATSHTFLRGRAAHTTRLDLRCWRKRPDYSLERTIASRSPFSSKSTAPRDPKRTLVGIAEKSSMLTSLKNAMSDEGP
jgi:hypothetical protein